MVIPAGFAQVNLIFTGAAVPTGAQVTFGVDPEASQTPADVALIVETALIASGILANLSTALAVTAILVKFGPNETGPSIERATNLPGTSASAVEAPNTAVLVHKLTAFGGRRGRGRNYWPGIGEGAVDSSGALLPQVRADLETDMEAFRNELADLLAPMVLLHSDATAPYGVDSLSVDARVATQRRRLRR